jgi:hypothetical protein
MTVRLWRQWRLAALTLALACPHPAFAQETMSDVLSFLLTNSSVQTGDFARDEAAARATSDTMSRALLVDLATLPVSSAGGGFAYRMNPTLGTFERVTDGFGPVFAERVLTVGRNQVSFGASYRVTDFDRLDGRNLRSGALVTTANRFVDEATPFDVETLELKIRASTLAVFANYGITERLDVGAVLPFVSLSITGERLDTYRGESFLQAAASASTTGPADLVVRAKYRLLGTGATGLSGGTELRLPTGSRDDLLGAGRTAAKVLLIGSLEGVRVASHANVGFVGGGVFEELDYNVALTFAVTPRLTLVGEAMGRRIRNVGAIAELSLPHPSIAGVETTRLVSEAGGSLHTAVAVVGLKVNLASTWLLSAHAMLPVTDAGLRPALSPMVSLEYSFFR